MHLPRWTLTLTAALLLAAAGATHAASPAWDKTVPLVDTPGPGGAFGYYGFDVFVEQKVAARFTVPDSGDFRLARVGVWLMNNSDTEHQALRVSVQTDALDEGGEATLPSGRRLEYWNTTVQTLGWDPVEQFFTTAKMTRLKAGRNYWVVLESKSPPFVDPVWTVARRGLLVSTTTYNGAWQPAGESGALTLRVDAAPLTP